MIELKLNESEIREVIRRIRAGDEALIRAGTAGVIKGMNFFVGKIQKEQMSGRPGLKAPTGTLRRANRVYVKSGTSKYGFVVAATFGFPNAFYVVVHQTGATIRPVRAKRLVFQVAKNEWRTAKQVVIPKRLHITEEFKKTGFDIVGRTASDAIASAFRKGQ